MAVRSETSALVPARVARDGAQNLRSWLPKGQTLPREQFEQRHRWISALLWAHVPGLFIFSLATGHSVSHSLLDAVAIAAIAMLAAAVPAPRIKATLTSIGLLTCSALLVHTWDGAIEAHFHFFVMIPLLSLYEDWIPFGVAIGYVLVHHGVMGALDPKAVFAHKAAQQHPWLWAGIHTLFVFAASVVSVIAWRMNEQTRMVSSQESGRRAEAEATAATLARSLRPDRLPVLTDGTVTARYLPAEHGVGGDWYDVIRLPGGRIGLCIGDVAGRGVEAASLMAGLRHYVRAYALDELPPAAIAERLDRLIDDDFATFVYLVYDPTLGTLRYANAGHLPPVVLDPDGTTRFLNGDLSAPLGAGFGQAFAEGVTSFDPGATLILYTDGLVERPGVEIDQGLVELQHVVTGAPRDPDAICDRLQSTVPERSDDVAFVAFQAGGIRRRVVRVSPEPEALAGARRELREWLADAGATETECIALTLAVGEALSNAVEHSATPEPIEMELALAGDGIEVVVRDYGDWKMKSTDDPRRGRGIAIMDSSVDKVELHPTPEGTTVRLWKELAATGSARRVKKALQPDPAPPAAQRR